MKATVTARSPAGSARGLSGLSPSVPWDATAPRLWSACWTGGAAYPDCLPLLGLGFSLCLWGASRVPQGNFFSLK